jgi:hypothetical protein
MFLKVMIQTMVEYAICITLPEELREKFEDYMRSKHIPDVLATGHFKGASISLSDSGGYRIAYRCENKAALEEYLNISAKRLREMFAAEFPFEAVITREILEVVDAWDPVRADPGP